MPLIKRLFRNFSRIQAQKSALKNKKSLNLNTLNIKENPSKSGVEIMKKKNRRLLKAMPYEATLKMYTKEPLFGRKSSKKEWLWALGIFISVELSGGWIRVTMF